MNEPYAWQTRATPTAEAYLDEGLRQHMLRVYNYMGLGLVLTGPRRVDAGALPADIRYAAQMGGDACPAGFRFHLLLPDRTHVGCQCAGRATGPSPR